MTGTDTQAAVERLAAACEAVECHGEAAADPRRLFEEVALLHEELRESAATCPDGVLGEDLAAMAGELEALLAHDAAERPGHGHAAAMTA